MPVDSIHGTTNTTMRGEGFGAGRQGRGAGRHGCGAGRGFDSNVWKRKEEAGNSSTTRASGSGDMGFEKWDNAAEEKHAVPPRQERWGGDGGGKNASRASGKNPTPPRQRDSSTHAGNIVQSPDLCHICNLAGHFTARCPQAMCERCKKKGHLSILCTEFLPWECTPAMCAFQSKGQGFYYIPDFSIKNQARDRTHNVVVTIVDGSALTKDIEAELSVYVGQGWRCSARFFAPKKFVMRMPNPREVERALFVEHVKLKKCGVSVKFSRWSDAVDSEGLLEIAWVRIGKIPLNKRCDKTVAYVGGLVGITLEVDMSTLNRPVSVRAKIGCRYVDDIPATAEGCLGGRFYKFTYEVEEVLVRNEVTEENLAPFTTKDPKNLIRHPNVSVLGMRQRKKRLFRLLPTRALLVLMVARPAVYCPLRT